MMYRLAYSINFLLMKTDVKKIRLPCPKRSSVFSTNKDENTIFIPEKVKHVIFEPKKVPFQGTQYLRIYEPLFMIKIVTRVLTSKHL